MVSTIDRHRTSLALLWLFSIISMSSKRPRPVPMRAPRASRSATANCTGPACSSILLCSLQDCAQESDSARTHSLGTQDLLLRLPEDLLPYYMGVTGLMQADEGSRPGCERANPRPRRRVVRYSKLPTHGSPGSCVTYPTCRGSHCCRSTAKVRRNEVPADVPVPEVLQDVPIQAGGLFSHDMLPAYCRRTSVRDLDASGLTRDLGGA